MVGINNWNFEWRPWNIFIFELDEDVVVSRNCWNLTLANSSCLCVLTVVILYNFIEGNGLIRRGQQPVCGVIGSMRSSVSGTGSVAH